jgi:hypothetical protein
MNIYEKLQKIQLELEVPKSQFNAFGKYNYRSCEDILSAVKPVAAKYDSVVTVSDEMVEIGGRFYIKATATLKDCESEGGSGLSVYSVGYAREEETKKGMDAAQITGAASSYARKYALNGLFCLDDTKDADSTNKHGKEEPASYEKAKQTFSGKATESQRQALGDIAKTFNLSPADMIAKMESLYNVKSSKDLTAEQASELLAIIQAEHIN